MAAGPAKSGRQGDQRSGLRSHPRSAAAPERALTKTALAHGDGFTLEDVCCSSGRSTWTDPEQVGHYGFVFVRRGCFKRRVDGVESVLDAVSLYIEYPGQEQQIAHPHDSGDLCTQIVLSERLAQELHLKEELTDRTQPILTTAEVDLLHRLLVSCSRGQEDDFAFAESLMQLIHGLRDQKRAEASRPRGAAARRRAVDAARQLIALQPAVGLPDLARAACVSPHHLSRIFRLETGETISRYRNRVRVRYVLERLADGERSLARLAADLGFADQAHLCRVVKAEVGHPPSVLRRALAR